MRVNEQPPAQNQTLLEWGIYRESWLGDDMLIVDIRTSLNPEYKKRDPDQLRSFASEVTRVKQTSLLLQISSDTGEPGCRFSAPTGADGSQSIPCVESHDGFEVLENDRSVRRHCICRSA